MKKQLNEQFIRMQLLAGLITESQINEDEKPNQKLELEKIYKEYCQDGVDSNDDEEDRAAMKKFVELRLRVSGGDKHDMGSVGMKTIEGFLNEIFLFNDMMDDVMGEYRGISSYETYESFEDSVNKANLDQNIKNELLKKYLAHYNMDASDEDETETDNEMDRDIKTILDNNGIDDDYFESMGGKEIETGTEEWLGVLSDITGKDAETAEFDKNDEAKIQAFMKKLEASGIELI